MDKKSSVASVTYSIFGVLIIIGGFVIGFLLANIQSTVDYEFHIVKALPWWFSGLVFGLLFFGIAKIMKLISK